MLQTKVFEFISLLTTVSSKKAKEDSNSHTSITSTFNSHSEGEPKHRLESCKASQPFLNSSNRKKNEDLPELRTLSFKIA